MRQDGLGEGSAAFRAGQPGQARLTRGEELQVAAFFHAHLLGLRRRRAGPARQPGFAQHAGDDLA
jgi:hypothetical protein